MYLVISALFFFVLAQQNLFQHAHLTGADPGASPAVVLAHTQQDVGTALSHAHSPAERARLLAAQAKIADALRDLAPPRPVKHFSTRLQGGKGPQDTHSDTLPATVAAYDASQAALPPARRDTGIRRFLLRRVIKTQQNKRGLVQGFLDNLPRMMFVLLPAFALLLHVTYWRTKRLYVAHLIFALPTHAFVFLILTGVLLLPDAVRNPAEGGAFLLMTVYLFAALKTVYGQNWGRTQLAFGWLGFNYLFLLTFAFVLTLGVAFLLA